jgi:hypothetical protein
VADFFQAAALCLANVLTATPAATCDPSCYDWGSFADSDTLQLSRLELATNLLAIQYAASIPSSLDLLTVWSQVTGAELAPENAIADMAAHAQQFFDNPKHLLPADANCAYVVRWSPHFAAAAGDTENDTSDGSEDEDSGDDEEIATDAPSTNPPLPGLHNALRREKEGLCLGLGVRVVGGCGVRGCVAIDQKKRPHFFLHDLESL